MQTGPTGFDTALAVGTSPTITVEADVWGSTRDLASMTSRIQVTRELAGDLPTLSSTLSGSVAAKASIDVDGFVTGAPNPLTDTDRLDWSSAPVRVAAGFAGLTVPVFTGTVREMQISELTREITVSALDGADRLRAPLTLPQFGSAGLPAQPGRFPSRPTNLSAVVTAALHANGIRMTPAPRAGCLFSVPGVGGFLAETGRVLPSVPGAGFTFGAASGVSTWTPGPFGPAMTGPGVNDEVPFYQPELVSFPWETGAGFAAEGYFLLGVSGYPMVQPLRLVGTSDAGGALAWYPIDGSGSIGLAFYDYTTATETVLTPGPTRVAGTWHQVALQVRSTGYWALWVDGALYASGTSTLWTGGNGAPLTAVVPPYLPQQAVQIHGYGPGVAFDTPTAAYGFTPQADVDQSVLDVDWVPVVEGRISWEVLKEVAAADGGAVGFSEAGRFFFRSAATLNAVATPGAPVATNLCTNPALRADADRWSTLSLGVPGVTRVVQGVGWAAQADGSACGDLHYLNAAPAITGAYYSARVMIDGPVGRTVSLEIQNDTTVLASVASVTLTGTPVEVTVVASAPATMVTLTVAVIPTGGFVSGDLLTATNLILEQVAGTGIAPDEFFDGSTPSVLSLTYAWTGTPDASTSTRTALTAGTVSTDIVANLTGGTALASVVSTVTATVRPRTYQLSGLDASGAWRPPVTAGAVLAFPPGTSSQLITTQVPVIIPKGTVLVWTSASVPAASAAGVHMVVLCTAADGSSGQIVDTSPSIPTVSVEQLSSTTLLLTVTNLTGVTVYTVIPTSWAGAAPWNLETGAPSLLLFGWSTPVDTLIPTITVTSTDEVAVDLYGPRTWHLPDSQWLQNRAAAQAVTDDLVSALARPRLLLDNVQTLWDPRWQLGDLLLVTDSAGRMPDQLARITAIDPTLALTEERQMTVKLGLRLIPPPAVTVAQYDARWAGSTVAHHDAQWAAARPGGVTCAQADALPLRVSP